MTTSLIDVNTIPDDLNAPWFKRFFKAKFNIKVRVRTIGGKAGYVDVWIPGDEQFPNELGNRCMRAIYPSSELLRKQNWGGNIGSRSLTMVAFQWLVVLRSVIEESD